VRASTWIPTLTWRRFEPINAESVAGIAALSDAINNIQALVARIIGYTG
jgi:hypothetical protein